MVAGGETNPPPDWNEIRMLAAYLLAQAAREKTTLNVAKSEIRIQASLAGLPRVMERLAQSTEMVADSKWRLAHIDQRHGCQR